MTRTLSNSALFSHTAGYLPFPILQDPLLRKGCRINFNTKTFKLPALWYESDSKERKEVAKRWISQLFNCQIFDTPGLTSYYWQAPFPPKLLPCGIFLCHKIWMQVKPLLLNSCGKNNRTRTLNSQILSPWFSHLQLCCQPLSCNCKPLCFLKF